MRDIGCGSWALPRLGQARDGVASAPRDDIEAEGAVARQRPLARPAHVAPTDRAQVGDRMVGARHGRVVTTAVRSPVRPATRWMRVVSSTSVSVIAGRIVVRRRANINLAAPGSLRSSRTSAERHKIRECLVFVVPEKIGILRAIDFIRCPLARE
jgi:hypothetical protein